MKAAFVSWVVVGLAVLIAAPVSADIVVLNNGQFLVGKVSFADSGRLKVTREYGDTFFAREQVAGYFLTPQGMEAEGYYQAGVLLLGRGQHEGARQLFEECLKYDASYRDKCNTALRSAATTPPPASPPGGAAGAVSATVAPTEPQARVQKIACGECSGSGVIMGSSRLNQERSRERPRPCPICGGKGYKVLQIPPGYEMCADCGGFGATMGSASSDTSSFSLRPTPCLRCAARGIVKAAFKPTEGTLGTELTGGASSLRSASSASETPSSAAMAPLEHARAVARRGVAGGSGPVTPPAVDISTPIVISESPAASSAAEETTSELTEDEGDSSEAASGESTEESESEGESESSSSHTSPGLAGWLSKHKWYVVLGGVAVLIFAIVFNKISGRK